jgi:hypothetical protein
VGCRCRARTHHGHVVVLLLMWCGQGQVVQLQEEGGSREKRQAQRMCGELLLHFHLAALETEVLEAERRRNAQP